MKIFATIISLTSAQGVCQWQWAKSGDRLKCLPNFYIDGMCESGRRDDCGWAKEKFALYILKFRGVGTSRSFGIRCCPSSRSIPIGEFQNCEWQGGGTGVNVECPVNGAGRMQLAVGRCSTSARNDNNGACQQDEVHSAFCCDTQSKVDDVYCGWLYETYGKNLICPTGLVATGFCGVNNKADCNQGKKFAGIKCCPVKAL